MRLEVDGYRALGEALEAAEARLEPPPQAVGAIRLLALTGAGSGEILRLRLDRVDLANRCLRLAETKTGQSQRPLGEPGVRVLRAILNRPGRPASDFVSPAVILRKAFRGMFAAWHRIVGSKYTPHGLRHAFASTAHAPLGLSELTIARLLGHTSARIGSTTHGYIVDPTVLAAADKVSRYIWEAMTGEVLSAEIIELQRADVA